MSPEKAAHTFVPWVREGYRPAEGATGEVGVSLALKGEGDETTEPPERVETTLSLYGPGEVTGIDVRQVVRSEPEPGTVDFPPNFFPVVEFDRADLPWLFTPEAEDGDGKLRPWICLVTVERGDGVTLETDTDATSAVLTLSGETSPGEQLPDLTQSWAWAHAQVVGAEDATAELEADGSVKTVSRLLSPRTLKPNTDYYACVVPTFEPGRLAGLGEDPYEGAERTIDDAWNAERPAGQIRLPVYYHWEFSTGKAGDFEALVRRLTPETLSDVGVRQVDASDPGPTSLKADGELVSLEGALRSVEISPDEYDPSKQRVLEDILDDASGLTTESGTADDGTRVLGPPTYGQWPPAASSIPDAGTEPAWLRGLNADPRFRIPAGFGTDVIQDQQEQLMASAWSQVGDIRTVNQLLRRARLAAGASRSVHDSITAMDPVSTLLFTEPLLDRTLDGTGTFASGIEASALSRALVSPAFRRITRPSGPLARRFGGLAPEQAVEDVADGSVDPGDTPEAPVGAQTVDEGVARELCGRARTRSRAVEAWHPLGDDAGRHPLSVLDEVRETCRVLRESTEKATSMFRDGSLERTLLARFVEPLIPVCASGEEAGPSELDDLETALRARDWASVHEVLRGVFRATRNAEKTLDSLELQARPGGTLDEALADEPGVTPAFERFVERLERLALLALADLLAQRCRAARAAMKATEAKSDAFDAELDALRVVCHALCGPPGRPGGLVGRLDKYLDGGYTRALRDVVASMSQLVAMAQARVEGMLQVDDSGATAAIGRLPQICESFDFYLSLVAARLAEAPWDPVADAVGPSVCRTPAPDEGTPLDAARMATAIADAIQPGTTIASRLSERLGGVTLSERDAPLDQILAHPEFPQPMYEALRDRSQEHLVPGVGAVPADSVGVLETNPRFIESYMLGLNHEMARELRWREFPSDLRGTYFRQFWDPEGRDPPLSDEAKKDIDYVHRWDDSLDLGGNYAAKVAEKTGDATADVGGQLVLLVRGELFHRYPNTHVYAARGEVGGQDDPARVPDLPDPDASTAGERAGTVAHPIFRGTLSPDVTFFGFDLTEAEAKADPGWFFVIEEPPSEPRFGLDVAVGDPEASGDWEWQDLTWDDVTADGYVSAASGSLADDVPDTRPASPEWAKNGAHMGQITWQRPFRVAIHADDLLPPNGGTQ